MFTPFKMSGTTVPKVAIVFVHGFAGNYQRTWKEIPTALGTQPALAGWDLLGFGYETNRRFDIRSLWSCDAGLEEVSTMLITTPELSAYQRVAFVAHSMGGLVVQRALVKNDSLRGRTSHLVLFGTPSAGLSTSPLAALKQQIRDMNASGQFIRQLRADWTARGLDDPPFHFLAVAGERDQFVPPASSLQPFGERFRAVIPGDHLTMLSTAGLPNDSPAVKILSEVLTHGAAVAGPRNAAALAVEEGRFQEAITELWPVRAGLDHAGTTLLAMALDARNRRQDAIAVLRARGDTNLDAWGVLAGRYKRSWQVKAQQTDLDNALELYQKGYRTAAAPSQYDAGQAFYHGINLAYLKLATNQLAEAGTLAAEVQKHCDEYAKLTQREAFWRLATEGDACTILSRKDDALAKHKEAAALEMNPWQALSMEEQAVRIADLCGWNSAEQDKLADLYLPR